jgi:multidrug transporter EmrE-like cation transporter
VSNAREAAARLLGCICHTDTRAQRTDTRTQRSWATLDSDAGTTFEFEPLGLVAGTLFVMSIAFSFAAIQKIGVALGQGLWGGAAILVSFLWGVIAFGDQVQSVLVAGVSLCLLGTGVLGIAFCESLGARYLGGDGVRNDGLADPLLASTSSVTSEAPSYHNLATKQHDQSGARASQDRPSSISK